MKLSYFDKKIYSFKLLLTDVFYIIPKFPELLRLRKNKEINNKFQEKIMTVVSAVNGCVYCKWFHAKQSLKAGISADKVKDLINLQFGTAVSDYELTGVLFAQHYAETNRNPETEIIKKLYDEYGKTNAEHIILSIRMIFIGNLYGNTLDAFVSRLDGIKASNSSLLFELWFFLNNLPVYIYLNMITNKKG